MTAPNVVRGSDSQSARSTPSASSFLLALLREGVHHVPERREGVAGQRLEGLRVVLRVEGDAQVRVAPDVALLRGQRARQQLHEGRLAAAVAPDHGHPALGRQRDARGLEDGLRRAGVREADS